MSERATDDPDLLAALADYFVTNAESSLASYSRRKSANEPVHQPQPQPRKPRFASYEEYQEHKTRLNEAVEEIANKVLLLNLEMPNGKRMRFCTGEEMLKFGKSYARIGKRVGLTKMVGSVLDEAGVRKLMG